MEGLPQSVNYTTPYISLPAESQMITVFTPPSNGSSFSENSQVQFLLNNRGFLDGKTLYVRYKMNIKATSSGTINIRGIPAYTNFTRLETSVNSVNIETIPTYGSVANQYIQTTMSASERYGMQSMFGVGNVTISGSTVTASTDPPMANMDGCIVTVATGSTADASLSLCAPLFCSELYHAEKLIPSFVLGQTQITLTLDSLSNILATGGSPGLTVSYSNFELCYNVIDMGKDVERAVLALGTFSIKSQGFSSSSVTVPTSSNGSLSLVFNQKFNSIKAAFVTFSNASAGLNKLYDYHCPSTDGTINITVGAQSYPQIPLSFANNKSSVLAELRKAVGSFSDRTNAMSINSVEFGNYGPNTATTYNEPSKFIVGVQLQKLDKSNNVLLSGISSQNSSINVNLNTGSYTTATSYNCNLLLNYDVLLQINTVTKQLLPIQ